MAVKGVGSSSFLVASQKVLERTDRTQATMDQKMFCNELADLGLNLKAEGLDARKRGLAEFAELGLKLQVEDEVSLASFVTHFVEHPNRLRWELLGQSALRRSQLSSKQRRQLDILGWTPDLLEPLRSRFDERSHTEVLAWLLDPRTNGLEGRPLDVLVERMNGLRRERGETEDLPFDRTSLKDTTVLPEVTFAPFGRVDVSVATPAMLLLIEVKVFATERKSQLPDYQKAATQYGKKRVSQVGFLTADPDQEPSVDVPHLTFRDLLVDWLPIAAEGDSGAHLYLGRYLSSVARLLGIAHPGDFDDWSFSARARALDLICEGAS